MSDRVADELCDGCGLAPYACVCELLREVAELKAALDETRAKLRELLTASYGELDDEDVDAVRMHVARLAAKKVLDAK